MITIKRQVELAKAGDEFSREFLKNYYKNIIEYYYQKYQEKISIEELTTMYYNFFKGFFNKEQDIPLCLYIHKKFRDNLFQRFDKKKYLVSDLITSACKGDLEGRRKTIEHFLPIVCEEAKKYNYMEYDDLVQYGTVKLIETIDNLISLHKDGVFHTSTLRRTIEIYFSKTLKSEVEDYRNIFDYSEDEYNDRNELLQLNDYQDKIYEIELENFIENYPCTRKHKKAVKKYFFEDVSYKTAGKENGYSYELVRGQVKEIGKAFQKIK